MPIPRRFSAGIIAGTAFSHSQGSLATETGRRAVSGLPPVATRQRTCGIGSLVPIGDQCTAANSVLFDHLFGAGGSFAGSYVHTPATRCRRRSSAARPAPDAHASQLKLL